MESQNPMKELDMSRMYLCFSVRISCNSGDLHHILKKTPPVSWMHTSEFRSVSETRSLFLSLIKATDEQVGAWILPVLLLMIYSLASSDTGDCLEEHIHFAIIPISLAPFQRASLILVW